MKLILETPRLLLREFDINDAANFYKLNINPNVIKFTGDRAFKNMEEAQEFLTNYSDYKRNGFGRWAVINKSDNGFLGWCGLKYDERLNETDIGFRFFEEQWNKGYATESAKSCLVYGFDKLGLKTIIGRARSENIASIKVLEKVGLQFIQKFEFDQNNTGVIYKIVR